MVGINAPFFFDAFIPSQERDRSPLPLARIVHSASRDFVFLDFWARILFAARMEKKKKKKLNKIKLNFGSVILS